MTQRRASCLNCGAPTPDAYCSQCGQKNADYREDLVEIVAEGAQELFQFDSRIGRTIVPFLFQPGRLSEEWTLGRRVRYSSPLRIYLLASFVFFLALSSSAARKGWHLQVDDQTVGFTSSTVNLDVVSKDSDDAGSPVDGGIVEDDDEIPDAGANVVGHVAKRNDADRYFDFWLSAMPKAVFAVLPIFALLLWLLFRRTRPFFVEHLVFAVHTQALLYVLLLVGILVPWGMMIALGVSLVHLAIALRRFYRPTWGALAWKLFLLVMLSLVFFVAALLATIKVAQHWVH